MSSAVARVAAALPRPGAVEWFRAPGRVNLIGDHTDYNEGLVLPLAIDRDCVVAARPAALVRVTSLDVQEVVEVPADGSASLEDVAPGSARTVAALTLELAKLGRPAVGMEAVLASDVPIGSGLSSSAAFEVALATALASAADWDVEPAALAEACREAEEQASGVPCGIMDQLVSVAGREGCALLLDCRSLEARSVSLPATLGLLVVHSGQARSLAESAYAERRRACEELARRLGLRALRDATPDEVADEPLGRHVVSENERVLRAAGALERDDLITLGELLGESHASLRNDFRVSTPELDTLVEEVVEAGARGARLTGAGFGGSVVAACDAADVDRVAEVACAAYGARTGLEPRAFTCHAVDGAGRFQPALG